LRKAFGPIRQRRNFIRGPNFESTGPDGEVRWCVGTARGDGRQKGGRVVRVSGVTIDITERKQARGSVKVLLAREVDHPREKTPLAAGRSPLFD